MYEYGHYDCVNNTLVHDEFPSATSLLMSLHVLCIVVVMMVGSHLAIEGLLLYVLKKNVLLFCK